MKRLTRLPTLHIQPDTRIPFRFMKREYAGVQGDSVASALYANGFRIFSRSLKYHRPRGLYSLDGVSGNCYMAVDGVPNVPTEYTPLKKGMQISPQNVKGSLERDWLEVMDWLDWAMPAGFYYRHFHKPYKLWPLFLNRIRQAAGLGVIEPDFQMPGRFDEQYINADVCVIGGGPAGIHAALAAAGFGLRVVLIEKLPWLGGFYDYRPAEYAPGIPLYQRAAELARKVGDVPNIRVLTRTFLTGLYSSNHITAFRIGGENDDFDERYIEIRAKSVVAATGCIERPLIFDNNDRPGVMQISCAHRLARTYGLLPGQRIVFSTGHDLGLEAALDLSNLGADIPAVVDCRPDGQDERLVEALQKRNIRFLRGWVASKAHGWKTLTKVTLSTREGTRHRPLSCDVLVASAGLTPSTGPLALAGAKFAYDHHTGFYLPEELPDYIHIAGRLTGRHHAESVEVSGTLAGLKAAKDCGVSADAQIREAGQRLKASQGPIRGSKLIQASVKVRRRFICFDEDVTIKHIDQACAMGFEIVELTKRFSACGTGVGQSGIPGHNLPLVISQYLAEPAEKVFPSKVRPPLTPSFLATYAGTNHDMVKLTPLYSSQEKAGGVFRRVGEWKRARYFSQDFTCREEIENVRNNVGLIDVSTLGKFRIFGPDAQKALQRVYVGDMSRIREQKLLYSAMCNEDGCLVDDGVMTKIGENDYYLTTSSGRAGMTAEWTRYHTRYEPWDFHIVNLTDALGAINVAGPNSRKTLQKLTRYDISGDAFPYMGYREILIMDAIPARVLRAGFTGELSFEIHAPASWIQTVWELLLDAGKEFGVRPFGLEAQNVLRLEKGHVIIGQESEIRTTLHDLGMGGLWKENVVGDQTIGVPALKFTKHQTGRLKRVGFKTISDQTPKDGAVIVNSERILGYICTSRYSVSLNQSIGMALAEEPYAAIGSKLTIFQDGLGADRLYAEVVPMPFFDPDGVRLKS